MSDVGGAPAPSNEPDWPAQAADRVVDLVDQVRAKTTGPAISAARAVVFGMLIAILGTAALILLVVGLVRILTVFLPVWAAHAVVGAVFVGTGALAWNKRRAAPDERE